MEQTVDPKDPNNQIQEFNLKEHKWLINGRWYYLLDKMPPRRYVEYLKLVPEVFFNTTFSGMHRTLTQIWKNCTSGNDLLGAMHSNAELAFNQISAIVDYERKEVPKLFELCAIILVREGEDIKEFDANVMQDKIDDFLASPYSVDSFFFLVMHSVPHFNEVYNRLQANLEEGMKEVV